MQTDNITLIEEMLTLTDKCSGAVRKFKELPESQLNYKKSPETWSILECIEHLNRYGDFYLPAMERAILNQSLKTSAPVFKSGLIGNYFANLMKIKNGKIVKMKTPADKNPLGSELNVTTIDRFLKQQEMLKSLLNQARQADLTKTKVPISLTKLIKLRLGDTFRFFVYHIERHVIQAENVKFKI
ncbi:MAG: DinB family protein [Chryseosolibacter sp.]